jgi:hypothetical protein
LKDSPFHIRTFGRIQQVKQCPERDLMVPRIARLGKEHHSIKQRLQAHQRTDSLIKWVFKKNH